MENLVQGKLSIDHVHQFLEAEKQKAVEKAVEKARLEAYENGKDVGRKEAYGFMATIDRSEKHHDKVNALIFEFR